MTGRLNIFEDVSLPAGAVVISVPADPNEPQSLGLTVARKNIDRPHLGPHGWQASEHVFMPKGTRSADGCVEMIFGGEITRHVGVDMSVNLGVPALGISERHFWPAVTAEQTADGINLQGRSQKVAAVTAFEPPAEQSSPDEPVTNFSTETIQPGVVDDHAPRRRWLLPASLAALFLMAIGLALFFVLLPQDEQQAIADVEEPVVAPAPVAVQPQPRPSAPDFAARYREYLSQQGHAEALLDLGRDALAEDATDIGFNAVTLSADRGFAEAKLLLAQWYDPSQEKRGPVRPNPNSAATYYADAAAGGAAQATAALQHLCQTAAASPAPEWSSAFDNRTHCP